MSEVQDGVKKKKFSKHPAAIARRRVALSYLEACVANVSPNHSETDVKRMKKEVSILKERI